MEEWRKEATHLLKGLERLKMFYIKKLLELDASDSSDHELQSLTIRELESLYKKYPPQTK
jgi:hypothetical protein